MHLKKIQMGIVQAKQTGAKQRKEAKQCQETKPKH
jgi:hypothetical protein